MRGNLISHFRRQQNKQIRQGLSELIILFLGNMSLWVDTHRPNSLSKLSLHPEITQKLLALAGSEELPHLLFYGPPGAGKKTRVMALLKEVYGIGAEKVKLEHRTFKTPSNKVIEIATLGSNYHIECNPSDAGNDDRFVIQEVIKEIASHTNLQSSVSGSRYFTCLHFFVDWLWK